MVSGIPQVEHIGLAIGSSFISAVAPRLRLLIHYKNRTVNTYITSQSKPSLNLQGSRKPLATSG